MKFIRPGLTQYAVIACYLLVSSVAMADMATKESDQQLVMTATAFRVGDQLIQGDRGTLFVQENRRQADSRIIEIAFIRLRHPSDEQAAPIVYLPGGPGQEVLEYIDQFAATYQTYIDMGGQGDMLLVEQRGMGASKPRLDCPGVLSRPADKPLSAEIMGSTHTRYVEWCIDHWAEQEVDLGGYHVVSMAADIDELRASLGYEQIKIFGESFGTHHALALIQNHGDHIERAVLSGVIGPDDMFEEPAVIERQLANLEQVTRNADGKALGESMRAVLSNLEEPVAVRVPIEGGDLSLEIGRYDLALATVTLGRQTSFLLQLPELYRTIAAGEISWLARWSANIRRGHQTNLASLAITCASGASAERRSKITEQAADSLFGDAVDLLGAHACEPFAKMALGERFHAPIKGDMPVLMISAALDPRAPPSNAEALLPGLSQGSHVVFPRVSHDFGDARNAQLDLVYRFLAHGDTEPDNALLPVSQR